MTNLKLRICTALILIPLVFLALFYLPSLYLLLLMSVVALMGAWEWAQFFKCDSAWLRALLLIAVMVGIVGLSHAPIWVSLLLGTVACLWLWVVVFCYQLGQPLQGVHTRPVSFCLAVMLLASFCVVMVWLRDHSNLAPLWLLYALIMTWIADSAAYFAGKTWGKNKLISRVSPGKTWEGTVASFVVGLIIGFAFSFCLVLTSKQRVLFCLLTLVILIAAVLGDLSISVLKRIANVKDSGAVIPGHGGVLDRLDSVFAVVLFFAAGLYLLGM